MAGPRVYATPGSPTQIEKVGGGRFVGVSGTPDQRLAAVAGAQEGRISRAQLFAVGLTAEMIKRRVRAGALHPCSYRGVYAVGHDTPTELSTEVEALLACGSDAVLSHQTAAALDHLIPTRPEEVHLTMPRRRAGANRNGLVVHRTTSLGRPDIASHRGLPVTRPARTLIDLADSFSPAAVERALDEALARRLISPTKLRETIARTPGRRGIALLEQLLDPGRGSGPTRSLAEERLLELVRAAGVPSPDRNVRIGQFVVDFLWRKPGLVIEVDSYTWHAGPKAFKQDRRKEAYLADHGLRLLRVTWEMLEQPLPLIARIVRAVG